MFEAQAGGVTATLHPKSGAVEPRRPQERLHPGSLESTDCTLSLVSGTSLIESRPEILQSALFDDRIPPAHGHATAARIDGYFLRAQSQRQPYELGWNLPGSAKLRLAQSAQLAADIDNEKPSTAQDTPPPDSSSAASASAPRQCGRDFGGTPMR